MPGPLCLDRRRTAMLGLSGAVLFSVLWTAAIYADGSWVFGVETLSELGDPSRAGHPLFNAAAVMSGMLLMAFAVGVYRQFSDEALARSSMTLAALGSLALIAVGVFPIHVTGYHTVASYAFFSLMVVTVILWTARDLTDGVASRPYFVFGTAVLVVNAAFITMTAVALAEAVAVISVMVWTAVLCFRLLRT